MNSYGSGGVPGPPELRRARVRRRVPGRVEEQELDVLAGGELHDGLRHRSERTQYKC